MAFARTLDAHVSTVTGTDRSGPGRASQLPDWFDDVLGWDEAMVDDETGSAAELELFDRVATGERPADQDGTMRSHNNAEQCARRRRA